MKKLLPVLLMSIMSVSAFAEDAVIDGIKYSLYDETLEAEVIQNVIQYSGDITFPESIFCNNKTYRVTSIGNKAFYKCDALTSVIIPNSVIRLDNRAFAYCSALTSITIPNSVTTIVGNAFYECTGLSEITIPSSVTSIGENAFGYCTGLESIIVEDGNTVYDSRDNCNAIIETETNTLIVGFKNTVIPVSVTSIARVAFSGCSGLSEITIPNSVTSISDFAFHNCESLTSVISLIEEPFEISSNVFEVVDFTTFTTNFTSATLLVPAGTKSKYESTSAWNKFTNIVEMELNSVKSAQTDVTVEEMERYNISGQRISAMQKGLNIVKMSDGTTKKVMFK